MIDGSSFYNVGHEGLVLESQRIVDEYVAKGENYVHFRDGSFRSAFMGIRSRSGL